MSENPEREKHTLAGDGEPTQPEVHKVTNFALGIFRDNADGHLFLGMLPVLDGKVAYHLKPYRFTNSNEETLDFFERFKQQLEGDKKRPQYLG